MVSSGSQASDFKVRDFEITAVFNKEGKVVSITYFSHVMSEQDISNLLAGNAPKAEWKIRSKEHTRSTATKFFGMDSKMVLGSIGPGPGLS